MDEDDDFSRVLMIALMILRFEERVKADGGETSIRIGKRAKKTSARVTVSSSSSSSWNNEDDGSTTPETTRTRTTTETTTTDMLKRLDEPVVLDWKALVRCFVKASVLSALLLRVWTILTRGGADAALTAAKSQRWFLLQKWFFSSNQQSLGFGVVVGVVSFALAFAALLVILEKEKGGAISIGVRDGSSRYKLEVRGRGRGERAP